MENNGMMAYVIEKRGADGVWSAIGLYMDYSEVMRRMAKECRRMAKAGYGWCRARVFDAKVPDNAKVVASYFPPKKEKREAAL